MYKNGWTVDGNQQKFQISSSLGGLAKGKSKSNLLKIARKLEYNLCGTRFKRAYLANGVSNEIQEFQEHNRPVQINIST